MLGFPGFASLPSAIQTRLQEITATTLEAPLDDEIIVGAIALRQQKKMSLGDAIIAATALFYGVPLVTRNTDDFEHIAALQLINLFESA